MKKAINFIIDDFKSDLAWLKNGGKINPKTRRELRHLKRGGFWLSVLKDYWLFFLLLIGFFLAGMYLGSIMAYKNYELQLVTEILPNCYEYQQQYRWFV